ncbi:type III-B CRISPR-associated protein Cas10/Cmr2 [Alysiella filiformis]|uniref:CRISPR-associated protein, Cmr2 family n=1 Tax=Alysiella filiformis DSM 16848 TaxID=1120981 RepID=A0A286ESU4_9NEIS|nr:type III-B CRISPR-associated protein Cas10/Cmr2 [Alysiella filiformis]QMT32133.1 type III-B CRISPR-associated protein Cas10/Cmr2 [Alysiella filiformis]UBQ56951.1 type III-B CRISPR-associated protein Cas10/Cmr2 [Alysiella filiformis DSM 16848]SOD74021.1 CRISPR-associated protein, Cmr2 family [Alysiella filiformis DSM 16848]
MSDYIVIISIGPVQSMIASARKSRDLWSGSWLLSELAKACAISLKKDNAKLIFPFVENDEFLKENSDFSVGNKLQAVITTDTKERLESILNKAKQAVQNRYHQEADNALKQLNQNDIRLDIWQSQIDDLVEIQWAWAKIENNDYIDASQKAGAVLASRKNTRDFSPLAICPFQSELRLPKSSLDGLRETVLKENTEKQTNLTRRKLSLAASEQLDVLGVIKRLGFGKDESGKKVAEQFTPISRVMADAWILEIDQQEPNQLAKIIEIYKKLESLNVVSKVTGNKDKNEQSIYKDFPYDAELLYQNRLDAEIRDWKKINAKNDDLNQAEEILKLLGELQQLLRNDLREYGEPYRYGALLLADGDRMGELLDKAKTQKQHQAITKALSAFAGDVADIMRKHRGHCIYAGGDDVLGLVPLDKAYACANALRLSFAESLREVANQLGVEDKNKPSLSVGLAICHLMTPFGVVREMADIAEKYAKGDHIKIEDEKENHERRNALAILLSVRGGSDIQVRFNWNDEQGLESFKTFVDYYLKKQIPSRVAYDMQAIYLRTQQFGKQDGGDDDKELRQNIQLAELTRMLKQARTDTGKEIDNGIIEQLNNRGKDIGLDRLADELIIARWLSAKTQKELGKE